MSHPIQRHLSAATAKASPEHKRFESLLARIQTAREHLQAWQTQLPLFAQKHALNNAPLLAQLAASRRGEEARAVAAEQLPVHMQRRALKSDPAQIRRMLKQWRADQRAAEAFF